MEMRKTLIINRKFQYSYILKNLALLLLAFALLFAGLKIWENQQVKQGFLLRPYTNAEINAWATANNVELGSADYFRHIIETARVYTIFQLLWKPLLAVLVLNIIILIVANVYYSHKIAGPVYRIIDVLERKHRGEQIYAIKFRKGDAFHELAETFNKVLHLEDKTPGPR